MISKCIFGLNEITAKTIAAIVAKKEKKLKIKL